MERGPGAAALLNCRLSDKAAYAGCEGCGVVTLHGAGPGDCGVAELPGVREGGESMCVWECCLRCRSWIGGSGPAMLPSHWMERHGPGGDRIGTTL